MRIFIKLLVLTLFFCKEFFLFRFCKRVWQWIFIKVNNIDIVFSECNGRKIYLSFPTTIHNWWRKIPKKFVLNNKSPNSFGIRAIIIERKNKEWLAFTISIYVQLFHGMHKQQQQQEYDNG